MRPSGRRLVSIGALVLLTGLATAPRAMASDLDKAIDLAMQSNVAAQKSQERVDKLSAEAQEALNQYRATQRQIESIGIYNKQVETLIAAQESEMTSLEKQIESATSIGREITPLMIRMLDALGAFVELDVPFLLEERRGRISELRAMMDRADVTDSEKYRRLLEAYQIENDFGRTIEAYQGAYGEGAAQRTVNFLRVGRISLVYQTIDGQEIGAWDKRGKAWVALPSAYRTTINEAFRIARKQSAPDLIRLPVSVPEDAQ